MKKAAGKTQGWSKQKKQFVALGALTLLLVVVLGLQLRDKETDFEVAALAEDAVAAPVEAQPEAAPAEPAPVAQDNAVLSQAPAEAELTRNPFTTFWSREATDSNVASSYPAPTVVLGITIPGGDRPLAVIDGELHFVGDLVQGWTLESVQPRSVVLRSPAQEQLVVEMPLFHRELLPAAAVPEGSAR